MFSAIFNHFHQFSTNSAVSTVFKHFQPFSTNFYPFHGFNFFKLLQLFISVFNLFKTVFNRFASVILSAHAKRFSVSSLRDVLYPKESVQSWQFDYAFPHFPINFYHGIVLTLWILRSLLSYTSFTCWLFDCIFLPPQQQPPQPKKKFWYRKEWRILVK